MNKDFYLFAKQTLNKITDTSLSVCLSLANDSSETIKVIKCWHADCLRRDNASPVNYIDLHLIIIINIIIITIN